MSSQMKMGAQHGSRGPARQRGSAIIFAALGISIAVILLSITNIGFLYFYKREYQKAVDLAALAGAAELWDLTSSRCDDALEAAEASLRQNLVGRTYNASGEGDIQCGQWAAGIFTPDTSESANAVSVTVSGSPPHFMSFMPATVIRANAKATQQSPVASFMIGSSVLELGSDSPLGALLGLIGIPVDASVLSAYNGLADVSISASGLLRALGLPIDLSLDVGTVNELLAAEISVSVLLDVALELAGRDDLLALNVELLETIGVGLGIPDFGSITIPLGTPPGGDGIPGLFVEIAAPEGTTGSALEVGVNVLDLVTAAVGVATGGHAVSLTNVTALGGVSIDASIVEPPSLAIGPVGTTAYNSQVRLYVDIDTNEIPLVGGLLKLLGTRVHLPIFIDVGRAKATLEHISCELPRSESTAEVHVDASVVQLCVGAVDGDPFSIRTPICESIEETELVKVLGLIRINDKIDAVDVLPAGEGGGIIYSDPYDSPPLMAGEEWTTPGNPLALGTTVSELVYELLDVVGGLLGAPQYQVWNEVETEEAAQTMADYYIGFDSSGNPVDAGDVHPDGTVPTVDLGWLGPEGAYNVGVLENRLSADIERVGQSCLLGIPFMCSDVDAWDQWTSVSGVGYLSLSGEFVVPGFECFTLSGAAADADNVSQFNNCAHDSLISELLAGPDDQPNFLQLILGPLLELLELLLDPLGELLAATLDELLGIEIGVNTVEMRDITCDTVGLVE